MGDLNPRQLTEILSKAADELPGASKEFFTALLNSKVFIPLQAGYQPSRELPLIGANKPGISELGFQAVDYQGSPTIPIFSEESFVSDWTESETTVAEYEFRKLLWLLNEETWLYLNPGQDVGKEITPWEIQLLRSGKDSIPELVAALEELNPIESFVVRSEDEVFIPLKKALLPILQIYPELKEAFLVVIQESENSEEKPALGVVYQGISEAKRTYLRSEIETASKQLLPGQSQLFLVDDLENKSSPNWRLFAEVTPFYIAQREVSEQVPANTQDRVSALEEIKRKAKAIRSWFTNRS